MLFCLLVFNSLKMVLKVKVLVSQLCPTLCDPMDRSPPGSSVHGILQARILKWVAIPFFRESSQPRDQTLVSPGRQILYHLSHQGSPMAGGHLLIINLWEMILQVTAYLP